ncbi:hypothetical protein ABKA04_004439 [Annulohypoxylon sp. FPYF3050]
MDKSNLPGAGGSNALHGFTKTGQAYREWTESIDKKTKYWTTWEYEGVKNTATSSALPKKGPRSLAAMCTTVVANNFNRVEHAHDLDNVPLHLLVRIWKQVDEDYKTMPLRTFMILSEAISTNQRSSNVETKVPKGVYRRTQVLEEVVGPLENITRPLKNSPLDFIVHLTLGGKGIHFVTQEIVALKDLKNLGILEIVQPFDTDDASLPYINDNVIRSWAEDPFPVLRVLKIWGDDFTTRNSLRYLDKFPALRIYDVAGRRKHWENWAYLPQWKKVTYKWGDSLVKKTTLTVEPLSSSTYADVSKIYTLMFCWKSSARHSYLRDTEGIYENVRMVVGEQEVARLKAEKTATQEQMDAFNEFLARSHEEGSKRRWWWAYMLYCHIGRISGNMDLVKQGMHNPEQSFLIESNLIPPRPHIHMTLGNIYHEDFKGRYQYYCTYVREADQSSEKRPASSGDPDPSQSSGGNASGPAPERKLTKKQRFFDMNDL